MSIEEDIKLFFDLPNSEFLTPTNTNNVIINSRAIYNLKDEFDNLSKITNTTIDDIIRNNTKDIAYISSDNNLIICLDLKDSFYFIKLNPSSWKFISSPIYQ